MGKELMKLLEECSIRKGGHNPIPTRPRPRTPPPGQGGKMSEYLEFGIMEQKPKTMIVGVWSKRSSDRLGLIKWYPGWRQYAFFPENHTVFNIGCLNEIQDRIKGMMDERRKNQ